MLLALLASILGITVAQWEFDYTNQGTDWDKAGPPPGFEGINRCGEEENQSPVNLMQPIGSYGWAYGAALPAEWDGIVKQYQDPKAGSEIGWEMKNLIMYVDQTQPGSGESFFVSEFGPEMYSSSTSRFKPIQFHFHHTSEHTLNGQYHEFEMHINHDLIPKPDPEDAIQFGSVGVLFSSKYYDQDITAEANATLRTFFEKITVTPESGLSLFDLGMEEVNFADVMSIFDFGDRYIYIGCSTLPPCSKLVYWNVLRKVYPIDVQEMKLLQYKFENNDQNLGSSYNIRNIYPINGHQIYYVGGRRLAVSLAMVAFALFLL